MGLACIAVLGWMALAIYFDLAPGATPWLRAGLALLVPVGALVALLLVRPRRWVIVGIGVAFVMVLLVWRAIPPSSTRDWQPDVATLPYAEISSDRMIVPTQITPVAWASLVSRVVADWLATARHPRFSVPDVMQTATSRATGPESHDRSAADEPVDSDRLLGLPLRVLRREGLDPVEREGELKVDRLLRAQGAVVVEGGDALGRTFRGIRIAGWHATSAAPIPSTRPPATSASAAWCGSRRQIQSAAPVTLPWIDSAPGLGLEPLPELAELGGRRLEVGEPREKRVLRP